jgi:hypothetical protein
MMGSASYPCMAFSILDYVDELEPSKDGKYICPACGGNDFSINKNNGAYTCWHDSSASHRSEIRNVLAPMVRWEKPQRDPGRFYFPYEDTTGAEAVVVHRVDGNGEKRIWQEFPTIDKTAPDHKKQLQEIKARILPYKYNEAVAESKKTGLPIIVVEGEPTCQAVWSVGLPSITFLGGSKQYRTNGDYSQLFRGLKLVLAPDRDELGVSFMKEIEADNPGAQWLYADPKSWEWSNLPGGSGLDLSDYIEDGATKDDLLASISSQGKHKGQDGKPSYEDIMTSIEHFVGLYVSDVRIAYETVSWLEARGVKMSQANIDKLIHEGRERVYGRQELDTIDALEIAKDDKCREWLIAGILPLGSVMLLAASGGTGKSTLIYNWALNIALGQPWSKRRCKQGRSLIIQSDEPLVDTSEKLGVIGYAEAGLGAGDIAFWETWRFAHMTQLEDYVRKHRPSFIAIDSLTACLAGMDVDLVRSNAGDVLYGLRDIANKYNCSVVILHHLNKSGGLRDSTSFVDNVSEVVKLTRQENNCDPNQFVFEWLKSRSGLTGKHGLQRSALNYGWEYQGPVGGSIEELDGCINAIVNRPNARFTKQQVASLMDSWDIAAIGKMLEVARRQGFITSTFQDGPNGEKLRLYHSFDYQEHDWTIDSSTPTVSDSTPIVNEEERDDSPIVSGEGSDESSNEATSAPEEPFVVVLGDKKEPDVVAVEDREDYYNFF